MGTLKDDFIKFRVNKELKNDFKAYTERYNTNMSEIFTDVMIELLKKEELKIKYQEQFDNRSAATEIKIAAIKAKKFSSSDSKKEKNFCSIFSFIKRFKPNGK